MNIRDCPEYSPFCEALITLVELFPIDLILYGIMLNALQIPQSLQLHIKVTHAEGTRAAWLKIFQWAIDTYTFEDVKQKIHDGMQRAGMTLRYRTFIRDYNLYILRPKPASRSPSCFSFLCMRRQ